MATISDSIAATTDVGDPITPKAEWLPDSPRGGSVYASPVKVEGSGAYSGPIAWVDLHFKTQGPEKSEMTPGYFYSILQDLPTGPHALHYRFSWLREDMTGGGETPWYDTGWFYVKTPPE
ncbi:hypothetical protein [Pseudomonas sp. 18173]|uniref:hypothetical protein n=1 Tax=Pseudomonas sp. 18173 TaxID=3390055 RepID=UPI003D1D0A03